MEETLLDNDPSKTSRRGALLTVLCILVWIGCTGVIGVNSLIFIELSDRESYYYYPEYDNKMNIFSWSALIFVCIALLSVAGSILMWLRRRLGFYLYLPAQLIALVLLGYLLVLDGALRYAGFIDLLIFGSAFAIPICFIVLFALQLRHMRPSTKARS